LNADELRTLMLRNREYVGEPHVTAALQLLLLTFVRPGELRQAEWSEFDLDRSEWRIPAERMKMRETHIVPLSSQTVVILRELKDSTRTKRDLLFPNVRNPRRAMAPTTMNRRLERMGYGGTFSAHGFRATASTYLHENGYDVDVIERQLAHRERNKVRASYNHASYLGERRRMMQEWANYLDGLSAKR
jgi:integrase